MKRLPIFSILVVLLLSSFAAQNRWVLVADKIVDFGVDRDVITVRGNDAFTKLKLRITDAPLKMLDMDVIFENGEHFRVPLQYSFHQGEESRVIDLPGRARRIKRIELLYETKGILRGKARVAVWGQR